MNQPEERLYWEEHYIAGNKDPRAKAFFILCSYDYESTPMLRLEDDLKKRIVELSKQAEGYRKMEKKLRLKNDKLRGNLQKHVDEINTLKKIKTIEEKEEE